MLSSGTYAWKGRWSRYEQAIRPKSLRVTLRRIVLSARDTASMKPRKGETMRKPTRLLALLAAVGAMVVVPAGSALAAADSAAFGQHVASCAREHLGQRADAPAVTCTMPDGSTMTFATFGAMVQHMRTMQAG
jgi:hypothetical protein